MKRILFSIVIWLSFPIACMEPGEKELEKQFFDALATHDIKTLKKLAPKVTLDILKDVLKNAINKNDTQVIEALINEVDLKDIQKALILAINTKNPETVKTVLNSTLSIQIDHSDENLDTPLIHALNTHNIDIIKAILTEVPNPSIKDKQKKTALEIANDTQKGLLANAKSQFELFEAIKSKNLNSIKAIIAPELLTSTILSIERNPLTAAISNKDLKTVELLVETVSEFDKKRIKSFVNQTLKGGMTPLRIAVSGKNADINMVKFLLENDANPNTPPDTFFYQTPLSKAIDNHNLEIIKFFLENEKNKADVNYQMPPDKATPLIIAVQKGSVDVVEMLLKFGADPLLQSRNGRTALKIAKREKETTTVRSDSSLLQDYEKIISILEKAEKTAKKTLPLDRDLISLLHKFTQSLQALHANIY